MTSVQGINPEEVGDKIGLEYLGKNVYFLFNVFY